MWYGDLVKSIHPLPINFPPALARLPRVLRCWLAALLCKFGNVTLYLWLYRQSSSQHTQWLMMMIWSKLSPQGVFLLFLGGVANHRRPTAIPPSTDEYKSLCDKRSVCSHLLSESGEQKRYRCEVQDGWDAKKKKKWTISWLISHANVLIFIISRIARSVVPPPPPASSPLQHH